MITIHPDGFVLAVSVLVVAVWFVCVIMVVL